MSLACVSSNKCFQGLQKVFSHVSELLKCEMKFAIYLPSACQGDEKVPVLYWLSGLTCTEQNFIQKSGAQKYAEENSLCIVCPDTSPRYVNIPGEDDSYDFGSGAGFYVDATEKPWDAHYKMFSYVTLELIQIVNKHFPVIPNAHSISGHSMGGHGALVCALRNPGLYTSVSAFAPISNPTKSPWGQKAFQGYLGNNEAGKWEKYDATELAANYDGPLIELFIDQGSEDNFYKEGQLLPENLLESCKSNTKVAGILKMREGYDHSYFYVASFIGEHIKYHSDRLKLCL